MPGFNFGCRCGKPGQHLLRLPALPTGIQAVGK